MNITLAVIGKTAEEYLQAGERLFLSRLRHYAKINLLEIPQVKKPGGFTPAEQKKHEAKHLLKLIDKFDYTILLDERGKQYSSTEFAKKLQLFMNRGLNNLLFVVGGPYGFDEVVLSMANENLSLSKMTFSHQMVRLFFLEQLYRAFTIIRGEQYHNR